MRLIIEPDYERMSKWAANYVPSVLTKQTRRQISLLNLAVLQVVHHWVCTKN